MVFSRFAHACIHLFAFLNIFIVFHVRGSAAVQFAVPVTNASLGLGYDTYWEHLTASAAPHFVIHSDKWISGENGPPAVTDIQGYNVLEGVNEYVTCTGLLTASSSTWPHTSVFQIAAAGVTLNKIVIGKPATTADASNGCKFTDEYFSTDAGVSVWQYPDAGASWIHTVHSVAFIK
ncbi:glycoside hydrolase family 18 protein [Paxillus rubicundulus Ve08.2h10]|uniref:Unplaced genomic scaffold scaffold_302, whole genome shotgun sequence n=1 Tax=Paxillus rubicundulus Ve08.2h10 TaxID=930991 RepID=A0A0D0DPY8_9AGAM|nr:glycoside hydrolase family 18 protein [Paxillus rubicundulus Ve08.2h10]